MPIDLPVEILKTLPRAVQAAPAAGSSNSGLNAEAAQVAEIPRELVVDPQAVTADLPALAKTLFRWAREQKGLEVMPAVERELIINALAETNGNQVQAAKLLGITRATLRKRVDKFNIRRELTVH